MSREWHVVVTRRVQKRAKSLGVLERLESVLEDWRGRLKVEGKKFVERLERETVVGEIYSGGRCFRIHRWRSGKYRVLYVIDYEDKNIVIIRFEHRKKAYKFLILVV